MAEWRCFMKLDNLQPAEVLRYFEEICSIPHGSNNLEKISAYLVNFAKEHNLKYRQDESLNVIIWKEASSGYENYPTVILQGHMDMVAVKEDSSDKDMEKDGLDIYVDGDYITADKTSLGGDDGIAVAYALAIMASDTIKHPAIEAVFTVNEEIGMLGAAAIDISDLKGKYMLNIDSEDEGVFTVGCAGGGLVECYIPAKRVVSSGRKITLTISGLTGGHSGVEIICQRANSNVLAGRILSRLRENFEFGVMDINGGEKDNAIAKFTTINMVLDEDDYEDFKTYIDSIAQELKAEFEITDPDMAITYETYTEDADYKCFEHDTLSKIIAALVMLPNGVGRMSLEIPGLVQTSDNIGVVRTDEDDMCIFCSVRSSVESEKEWLVNKIVSFIEFLGGFCKVSGTYPAWEYNAQSKLREHMVKQYTRLYGKEPVVETIHAGVECGMLADKLPGLDCISFGPDIIDIHTTKEKLSISSVERTWKLILAVLENISEIQ